MIIVCEYCLSTLYLHWLIDLTWHPIIVMSVIFGSHCINNWRLATGYIFLIASSAIFWSSKRQSSTALSSTEAEYMAALHAIKEAIWLRNFIFKISQLISLIIVPLLCDN